MRTFLMVCAVVGGDGRTLGLLHYRPGPRAPGKRLVKAAAAQTLVYADFENGGVDGKPVSSPRRQSQPVGYQESPTRPSVFKGSDGTTHPRLVRTSSADQNHAAAFEYELVIPNEYAGVTIEVQGQPDKRAPCRRTI
jgi:hypothetical protein